MTSPELAVYPNENEGDGRYYKHPLTGERLPSITSVLRMADKSGLSQWAADEAMRWAVSNWQVLGSRSDEKGFAMGRYQWKKTRDERAWAGDQIHTTIEYLHTGRWDLPDLNEEQMLIMEHWDRLNEEHSIEPILSEFTVWNAGNYAGTADGYWLVDGVKCAIDVKTSRSHWPEHDAQLAAIVNAPVYLAKIAPGLWEERPAPEYERVGICHLRADKHQFIWIDNIQENFDVFMAYRSVWGAKQGLREAQRALEKEREDAA